MTPSGLRNFARRGADAATSRCYVRTLPLLTLPLLRADAREGEAGLSQAETF